MEADEWGRGWGQDSGEAGLVEFEDGGGAEWGSRGVVLA